MQMQWKINPVSLHDVMSPTIFDILAHICNTVTAVLGDNMGKHYL
jgi:hypothetical protein